MRILIIEDDTRLASNVAEYFQANNYQVDICDSAEKALVRIKFHSYALILLDWMLPDMQGIEFLKKIREQKVSTPVIMTTAKAQLEDKVQGFEYGADDYVTKPYTLKELLYRVSAIIRRTSIGDTKTTHIFDTLEVNFNNHSVKNKGVDISLTPKEFAILELLLLKHNAYVSRDDILNHVWDQNAELFTNTIEVHIKNLRKKIDKDHDTNYLITGKGIGYMLKFE